MSENRQISDTLEWKLLRSLRQHVLDGRIRTFRRTRGLLKDIGASNWNKMKTMHISLGRIFSMSGLDVVQDCGSWDEPELYYTTLKVLTDLCSLLNSITNPTISLDSQGLEGPYQILKGLLRHIKTTPGSYDLIPGANVNLFDFSRSEDMEKDFERVVICNDFFQMVLYVPDEMQSPPGFTSWSADSQDPFRNHETKASHVLMALFAGLGTCKHHQLLLQLPVLYEAGSDFIAMPSPVDLFLSTCLPSKTTETKPGPSLIKRLAGNVLSSLGVQSKELVPGQSEPETREIRTSREWQEARVELLERMDLQKWREEAPLCDRIRSHRHRGDGLRLGLQDKKVVVSIDSKHREVHNGFQPQTTLLQLLSGRFFQERRSANPDEIVAQRALAARLTLALMLSFVSEGTIEPWDPSRIHFLCRPWEAPSIDRAYICCGHAPGTLRQLDVGKPDDTEPPILFIDFAKLLLQVGLGGRGEYPALESHQRSTWSELQQIVDNEKKKFDDVRNFDYLSAVESCLRFHLKYDQAAITAPLLRERMADTARRVIHDNVFRKIMDAAARPKSIQESRKRRNSSISHGSASGKKARHDECQTPPAAPPVAPPVMDPGVSQTNDATNIPWGVSWFNNIENVKTYLNTKLYDRLASEDTKTRVKIAIIDTGCQDGNQHFYNYAAPGANGSIAGHWDFVEDRGVPMIDNHGHGTHMAHLVFMTAEHVDVYVARVWDGEEVQQTASRVARAIEHAANPDQGWGVDIISLSLSLGKSPDQALVKRALEYAKSKGALVFASASNNRHDRELEIGFPASAGELTICINSHNGNSERSPFSPLPQRGRANLAVLGQGITAAWKDNSMAVQEGTSISTAVAAGIAAIVLDYARQLKTRSMRAVWTNDGQMERNGLRDIRVMKKIMFDLMVNNASTEGHAYNILKPWILFKTNTPLRSLTGDILEDWEVLISSRLRETYQECQDFRPGGLY